MSTHTHSFRYTATSSPNNSEDRVLAGNRFTDDAHCVVNATGYLGFYIDGVFTQMGNIPIGMNRCYSIIIVHDDAGNGAIYLGGQKLGQVANFPKTVINQIGNFSTGLRAEDGRRPHDRLRARDEGSMWTRPCLGIIDELVRFDRELSSAEIVDLAQNGTISKTFGLADYYVQAAADDGKISPIEKPTERSYWIRIWNEDQRTTPLPVLLADITVDGEYKALATAASEANVWTPTTLGTAAYVYYQAIESWRKMLFDASVSGFLLTANLNMVSDISGLSPDYDARLSALVSAEKDFQYAIVDAKGFSEEGMEEIVRNSTPRYRGTIQTAPSGAACLIIKGPDLGNVTVKQGDWVLMIAAIANWVQGSCYLWTGTDWLELDAARHPTQYQDAMYDILSIAALTSNTGYYGALFAKVIMAQKAAIDALSVKVITLQSGGKIQSKTPATGFSLDGDTGKLTAQNADIKGKVVATEGEFSGAVHASSGEFNGAVYASSGEFTGVVHASSGEFTGVVNASSGSFTGAVHASSGEFTGDVYANNLCTQSATVRPYPSDTWYNVGPVPFIYSSLYINGNSPLIGDVFFLHVGIARSITDVISFVYVAGRQGPVYQQSISDVSALMVDILRVSGDQIQVKFRGGYLGRYVYQKTK